MLCQKSITCGYETKVATEDADTLIVTSAIEKSETNDNVVIIGQDIDLLVILNQLGHQKNNLYFKKIGDAKNRDLLYSSCSFMYYKLQHVVGFLHAFSGCDTTSGFYHHPKNKITKLINNNQDLIEAAEKFYNKDSTKETLGPAAIKIIAKMYSSSSYNEDLGKLRFENFQKTSMKSGFKLESLPHTNSAAKCHGLRVFLQLQKWLGVHLNKRSFGWKYTSAGLRAIFSEEPLIPEDLIQQISCSCKTGCTRENCKCRKHGLLCTNLFSGCQGDNSCMNCETYSITEEDIDALLEERDALNPLDVLQIIHEDDNVRDVIILV